MCLLGFVKFYLPLSPHDALKHHFTMLKTDLIFLQLRIFLMKIPMKLVCQYMVIIFNFSLTSSHLHPLQAENRDSNSRLVADEDDKFKFRFERVKGPTAIINFNMPDIRPHFVSRVDLENPWVDLFHIAHTHALGGGDVPLCFFLEILTLSNLKWPTIGHN